MEPSSCDSTDSLDRFFMSLSIGHDGKTLKTSQPCPSLDAAKMMQDGITHNNPKLFGRWFDAHFNQVVYGIEPNNVNSCKEGGGGEKNGKFLHMFEAEEKGGGNEDIGKKIEAFSSHEAAEEETYEYDIDPEDIWRWLVDDEEDEDSVHAQK